VRVEAYDFRTASQCDLSLFKDELIALNLCTKSSSGYDSDMEEDPPVLTDKACLQLLDMLLLVKEEGVGSRLTLRSMRELRAKMEVVERENAAVTLQSSVRTKRAHRDVATKKEERERFVRETTPINLHRQGVCIGGSNGEEEKAQVLLRVVGTIGEMTGSTPTVHVNAMEVKTGAKHTMTLDGPAWKDGRPAIKAFCKQLSLNLEFVTTPEGERVLRAKGSKAEAAMLQAAEDWRTDPFKAFVGLLKSNTVQKLNYVLEAIPGAVEEKFAENHTPLHFAAANGNMEFVKLLIEHGANVNSTTKENATPAMYAVPGAIASGSDGLGDEAREKTLQYLLSRPDIDLTIAGTRGWCLGKTVQEIREAYGAAENAE